MTSPVSSDQIPKWIIADWSVTSRHLLAPSPPLCHLPPHHHRHHQLEPGLLDLAVDSHPGHPHPPLVAPNLGSLCLRACIRVCVHARVYGCEYRSLKK